jgi:hypothetical protein
MYTVVLQLDSVYYTFHVEAENADDAGERALYELLSEEPSDEEVDHVCDSTVTVAIFEGQNLV